MAIFNSPYYKENCLPKGQTAIMPGIINVPKSFNISKPIDIPELTDIPKPKMVHFKELNKVA